MIYPRCVYSDVFASFLKLRSCQNTLKYNNLNPLLLVFSLLVPFYFSFYCKYLHRADQVHRGLLDVDLWVGVLSVF